ncbi:MAG TPA: uracil-DNA glycosylase family protein, partial [Anaerolineae bacterium]|nr:uracil-DNA glycosylase family protein [Anaerolineae bacterium]
MWRTARHQKVCGQAHCPLKIRQPSNPRKRTECVPAEYHIAEGYDHTSIDVLIIGEAPGADEDARARPFVGKSGNVLRTVVER